MLRRDVAASLLKISCENLNAVKSYGKTNMIVFVLRLWEKHRWSFFWPVYLLRLWDDVSHDMTKPTEWVCAQRRLRSAWAFAQSDQSFRCAHEESLGPYLPIAWVLTYPLSAQWRLWSDWADGQADLSLRWAHTHFVGFVMSRLMFLLFRLVRSCTMCRFVKMAYDTFSFYFFRTLKQLLVIFYYFYLRATVN